MSLITGKVLGINLTFSSKNEILEYARKYLIQKPETRNKRQEVQVKPLVIVTPNPEQVMLARRNPRFAEVVNRADLAICDGIGLAWASQLLSATSDKRQAARISGVELMEDLVGVAAVEGVRVGLIGGTGNVAVETFECLQKKHPGLSGFATSDFTVDVDGGEGSGEKKLYFFGGSPSATLGIKSLFGKSGFTLSGQSITQLIHSQITLSNTAWILFVGLGAPKQELFIEKFLRQVTSDKRQGKNVASEKDSDLFLVSCPLVLMSVGGAFDVISGNIRRAPRLARAIGLEWCWRLVQEPWRWRRQLVLVEFVGLVIKEWLKKAIKACIR